MKTVLITGGSKGIGYGLADAFLAAGCAVSIASRSKEAVDEAVAALGAKYKPQHVYGYVCDVSDPQCLQALWDNTVLRTGKIDIWINNAGQSNAQNPFWQLSDKQIKSVVSTNIEGTMYGSKVAINGMIAQGHGALYNFLGFGSDGMQMKGLSLYGSTKYGVKYFTDALKKEVRGTGVIVGSISPGMVATDLLLGEYKNRPQELKRAKRIFNILADKVETVAPWIVKRVLCNKDNGADIAWLTKRKILWRFITSPLRKRNIIP